MSTQTPSVLIPLNSGLVFVLYAAKTAFLARLNPFEFRAGICLAKRPAKRPAKRLNPFEFRAGICLCDYFAPWIVTVLIPLNSGLVFVCQPLMAASGLTCLNPFEFRAGICLYSHHEPPATDCLNPFEFRAGICLEL